MSSLPDLSYKTKILCSIIVLIKITGPDGLERPKAFDYIAPRVKLHIVAGLEDAMWFVELHNGIFFYTLLELAFNKLLAGNLGFSFDDPRS
jgi:hypothetical protein